MYPLLYIAVFAASSVNPFSSASCFIACSIAAAVWYEYTFELVTTVPSLNAKPFSTSATAASYTSSVKSYSNPLASFLNFAKTIFVLFFIFSLSLSSSLNGLYAFGAGLIATKYAHSAKVKSFTSLLK